MKVILTPSGRPAVPTDFPALPVKLGLICKACGRTGQYEVGRVYLDPQAIPKAPQNDDWLEEEEKVRAAEHFALVLRYCRAAPPRNAALWHDMVRDSLETLFDLHRQSEGRIPFPPPLPLPTSTRKERGGGPDISHLNLS